MSRPLSPSDIPRRLRGAQVVPLPDGRLLVRHRAGMSVVGGVALVDLRRVLARVDGRRSAGEIVTSLAGEYDPDDVLRLFGNLHGELIELIELVEPSEPTGTTGRGEPPVPASPVLAPGDPGPLSAKLPASTPVVVLGDGSAARSLAARLRSATGTEARLRGGTGVSPADLAGAGLVLGALEGVTYGEIFAAQAACRAAGAASVFLTADPDGLRLGPTTPPDAGPCFACSQLAGLGFLRLAPGPSLATAERFRSGRVGRGASAERALAALVAEAFALLQPPGRGGEPELVGTVLHLPRGGGRERRVKVERRTDCPVCGSLDGIAPRAGDGMEEEPGAGYPGRRAARALVEVLDRRPPRAMPAMSAASAASDGRVTSVGIVGGGTAGYLAALALRTRLPHLAVTLIESPDVPIIGVGEATTPLMPQFLHVDLGLDVHQLFREVQPTLKLGIRFLWGMPGDGDFSYPFGPLHVVEPLAYGGDLVAGSLQGLLMAAGAVPLYGGEGEAPDDWACRLDTATAYHLDNQRFVAYLMRRAAERGVERIAATVADFDLTADGSEVAALRTTDGRRLAYDLYLDCSGFRSLLLERALGSPWISYAASLPTDRAVVAPVPQPDGQIRPYTTAETMQSGWCWSTPQLESDHRGYVFSSAFLGDAEAEDEMRRANPGMGAARMVHFRAGRHAHFWKGNVVALGNAYGFVEPLESTALHMLVRQIGLLVGSFPLRRGERGLPALHDARVGAWWDYLRWFLAIHYRFNRRVDSPFWRACREEVDVSSHADLLAAFAERGPLSYDPAARAGCNPPDPLWGPEGIDVLLLGQGVPAPLPRPALDRAAWERDLRLARSVVARAAPHRRALELLAARPELLEELAAAFRVAGPAFASPVLAGPRG